MWALAPSWCAERTAAQQGIVECDVRGHYHDMPFWSWRRSCMSNYSTSTGSVRLWNAHLRDGVKAVFV